MNELENSDTDAVIAVLQALQEEMTADLADMERRLGAVPDPAQASPPQPGTELDELRTARVALYSGLASIREVLGWIEWITEKDPEEETSVAAQPLPTSLGFPIH